MARHASSRRSPNFAARYFTIRAGLPGLPLSTARSHRASARPVRACRASRRTAARPRPDAPRPRGPAPASARGCPATRPWHRPLARHGLPNVSEVARSKPSRSATTVAQSVRTLCVFGHNALKACCAHQMTSTAAFASARSSPARRGCGSSGPLSSRGDHHLAAGVFPCRGRWRAALFAGPGTE